MQDPMFVAYVLLTLAGAFVLLAAYAAVPALLAFWLGIKVERISIGVLPVFRRRIGDVELSIGSLPIAARTKFYGDEAVFGLRVEEWPSHRNEEEEPAVPEDDPDEPDEDEQEPEPEEPPPDGSFPAASPAARAALLVAGPAVALLIGMALLWACGRAQGPLPVLADRDSLPSRRGDSSDPNDPWRNFPVFSGRVVLRDDAAPSEIVEPIQAGDAAAQAAAGLLKLLLFMTPAEGFAGYLSWPVLLVRSFEVSPAYCLGMFGLFACVIGALNLMPLPIFNGGMALMGALEAVVGARLPRRAATAGVVVGFLWFAVIVLQVMLADISRFG